MKEIKDKRLRHFCTGCGLCQSLQIGMLAEDERGFFYPHVGNEAILKTICPSTAKNMESLDETRIWGARKKVYLGWSNHPDMRNRGSSGAVLSEALIFLLEQKLVDAVIHCGADCNHPTMVEVFFSESPEEIQQRAGSRYAISHPLIKLSQIDLEKKYAFVGRPCDIATLRNYLKSDEQMARAIVYLFSFFCMGTPSNVAQEKLMEALSCTDCHKLTYRGNGWPGYTVAVDGQGKIHTMTYQESWGNILGRDLMPLCKFCIDGIGEEADISCGDAWYQTEKGDPDFTEHDGRNIVFARTDKGANLLEQMQAKGVVTLMEMDHEATYLNQVQKSQKERRQFLAARILALKILGKPSPCYSRTVLREYSSGVPVSKCIRAFLGTMKRGIQKKV